MDQDDWRLLNDVEHLRGRYLNPTDGEDICKHAPHLKHCAFCWDRVEDNYHQWWFAPEDLSCCICEACHRDFEASFGWKKLDGWDIQWFVLCPKCGSRLKRIAQEDYVYECGACQTLYSEDLEDELELQRKN